MLDLRSSTLSAAFPGSTHYDARLEDFASALCSTLPSMLIEMSFGLGRGVCR